MRIRSLLLAMAAAILLPIIIAAGLAIGKIRQHERDAALRGLSETVRATALTVDREVQGSLSALTALARSEHLETGNLRAFHAQASALDRKPDIWTVVLDTEGRQLVNTAVPFGAPMPDLRERGLRGITQVIAAGQPVMSGVAVGPGTRRLLTALAMPAAAGGGRRYVVAQLIAMDHWARLAFVSPLPGDWIAAVIDKEGLFIARSHRSAELLGKEARRELVQAAARSQDGLIRHRTMEGIDAYDAFTHSALTGWTIAVAAPAHRIEQPAVRALQYAVAGMLLALGAAVVAMLLFGRRIVIAIEHAQASAMALGRGSVPETGGSAIREFRDLDRSLVDAGRLLQRERRSREGAETHREELLRRETSARELAQAQNVAKDQFLAMLGHELRNPLAAISGAASVLEMGGLSPQRAQRYLDIIRRQNRHLARIVNDLLDVSRLLAGKIVLERQPLDLAEAARAGVESARAAAGATGVRVDLDLQPAWIDGDAARIEQILSNLLTNAIKFSPPSSIVRVVVRQRGGEAELRVEDQGAGIPSELLPHVFEPFMQGPTAHDRAPSGLGIGLALVRQLVELHGGRVAAESEGPGRGAVFRATFPGRPVPAEGAPDAVPVQGRHRIVFVEDNDDARMTMSEILRTFGYEVIEVASGGAAVPVITAERPDVVVLDIGLPDIDGREVACRLHGDGRTSGIPLIALTGYGQESDVASRCISSNPWNRRGSLAPSSVCFRPAAEIAPGRDRAPGGSRAAVSHFGPWMLACSYTTARPEAPHCRS